MMEDDTGVVVAEQWRLSSMVVTVEAKFVLWPSVL